MLWIYPPVWQVSPLERLEWKTDVISAFDGSEQRIALRQTPRRYFEFSFLVVGDKARRELEVKLWANGAKPWDLPVWTESTLSTNNINSGSSIVPVDTEYRDFVAGNKVLLQSHTGRYHVATVQSINTAYLVLTAPLADDWPLETTITPIRKAYLDPSQQVTRFTGDTVYDSVRFQFDDISSHAIEFPEETYRGYPVLTIPSNWDSDPVVDYQRKMQVIDFGNGGMYRDDETGQPALLQSHFWTLTSREQINQFREFLYSRRGRLAACWLPSFLNDMQLIVPISSGSTQIIIEHCNYTTLYQMQKNRRDIRLELSNGTILYRRIVACVEIGTLSEQLTLDSPITADIAVDDVERMSFMPFSRLLTDGVELSWQWGDIVNVQANWRSIDDDV